jgi:DNA-directed RNA polymerase
MAIFSVVSLSTTFNGYSDDGRQGRFKALAMLNKSIFNGVDDREIQMKYSFALIEEVIDNPATRDIIEFIPSTDSKDKTGGIFKVDQKLAGDIMNRLISSEQVAFFAMPMSTPPVDWHKQSNGVIRGGDNRNIYPFIKRTSINLRNAEMVSDEVLEAVNKIQAVPFRINKDVLEALKMESTEEIDRDSMNRNAYKLAVEKRSNMLRVIDIADSVKDHDKIYFPHHVDYRGRMYPIPVLLNPQAGSESKGLLEYAEPIQLSSKGIQWLYATAAATYGEDKLSFQLRVELGREKALEWNYRDADEKSMYHFLQIQNTIRRLENDGDLECRVNIPLDGSCNGLQHLAAITKDREAGRSVNLTNTSDRYDIYQMVADIASDTYKEWYNEVDEIKSKDLGEQTLGLVGTRKIAKTPVMVYPYSGTEEGSTEALHSKIEELDGFSEDWISTRFFARNMIVHLRKAIMSILDTPEKFMKMAKLSGRRLANENKAPVFTTPDGFTMINKHPKLVNNRIQIRQGKRIRKLRVVMPTNELNPDKIANSMSPNLIHSLDACHLRMTVNGMSKREDLDQEQYLFIHDSFGTNPNDASKLARTLREEFAGMYSGSYVADSITECLGVDCPVKGDYDPFEVMKNQYFFA